jgi:hypothetical protein
LAAVREQGKVTQSIQCKTMEQNSMGLPLPSAPGRRVGRPFAMLALGLVATWSCGAAVTPSRAAETAGRYAVLRADDKDTGCMITLQGSIGGKAQLAPACRDNGIVIFDPVAWSLDHGKLVLKARKGHKTELVRDSYGLWRRDPKEGKALALRPL